MRQDFIDALAAESWMEESAHAEAKLSTRQIMDIASGRAELPEGAIIPFKALALYRRCKQQNAVAYSLVARAASSGADQRRVVDGATIEIVFSDDVPFAVITLEDEDLQPTQLELLGTGGEMLRIDLYQPIDGIIQHRLDVSDNAALAKLVSDPQTAFFLN